MTGGAPAGALGERDPPVCSRPSPADRLDRRRRRAEDAGRPGDRGEPDGGVAGLDPRRPVALVGPVVLLVDDDEADVRQRREDGRPRADDHVDRA